jgi:hypothetical protein
MSSIPDEIDQLVVELGASLTPSQYTAFAAAAHAALGNCSGPGAAYRILRDLQRNFYDPPRDAFVAHEGARHYRPTKLTSLPPIGRPDRAEGGQQRNAWRRGA